MFINIAQPVKLCKNCTYFKPRPNVPDLKYGLCTKFVNLNKVDGSVEFSTASVAREFDCKEKFYEPRIKDTYDI
jgi:hypothetical protein